MRCAVTPALASSPDILTGISFFFLAIVTSLQAGGARLVNIAQMSAASEHYTIAIVDFTGKLGRGPLPPPFTSTEANCSARRITPMHAVKKGVKPMAKYILLVNWTDQGIRNIKDSAKRLDAGRALARV
jgi:hypothetical protein